MRLEAYAEFMELNAWTGTTFTGGEYDEANGVWTARLTRADGTDRTIRCPHLVLATGGCSGVPSLPDLPGLSEFGGDVLHSSTFGSGISYAGKRAIVFGTGNSGHDVAQDLQANAAQVTMTQRSPTCVVSLVPSGTMVYALYSEGPPNDDIDLITAAIPYPVLRETYQWLTKRTCALDQDLLDRLHAVGFETDYEPDGTGFHMKYLRKGGGYYINVGCSDLLGDEVAGRVGPIWGFDEHGAMRNMRMRTAQPGFWVMGGSLIDARLHSKFLAVQIKAQLDGIFPAARPA